MSELKVYVNPIKTNMFGKMIVGQSYYLKSEVDKVIAEKDKEIAELKEFIENYRFDNKNMLHKIMNQDKKIRMLKRALWLAREWRAWCEGQFWFVINGDEPRDVYHLIVTKRIHRTPTEWIDYWYKVEQKCKAKAEEYNG